MKKFMVAAIAATLSCGALSGPAAAMPLANLAAAIEGSSRPLPAGYECGPFGCWPSSYYDTPAYLRPRAYYGMEPYRQGYDQWRWFGFGPNVPPVPPDRKVRRPR
jgi:hypothetical protein